MEEFGFEGLLNALGALGAGVERERLEELISQIGRLAAGFSLEEKERIVGLFLELAQRLGWEELPSGFREFLERWKKGE